jgi:hypothetical protein
MEEAAKGVNADKREENRTETPRVMEDEPDWELHMRAFTWLVNRQDPGVKPEV